MVVSRALVVAVLVASSCGDQRPAAPCEHAFYADRDGDGLGDPAIAITDCTAPAGFVANADDCDDACATCARDAVEQCDGAIDDNCNGSLDEGCACVDGSVQTCPGGSDVGSCRRGMQTCRGGLWQECTGRIEPAVEQCNGVDDDCDGEIDGAAAVEACGEVAHASTVVCAAGECVVAGCAAGFEDCDGGFADGCETDLGVSATCGGCDTKCAGGLACELGSCVALPRLLWSTEVRGTPSSTLVNITESGDVVVGGIFFNSTLGIGTLSVSTDPERIYLGSLDATGNPRWLVTDGVGPIATADLEYLMTSSDGTIYTSGRFSLPPLVIAGETLESSNSDAAFVASYSQDGVGRWARSLDGGPTPLGLFVGDHGVDVSTFESPITTLERFEVDGTLAFTAPSTLLNGVVGQAHDGRALAAAFVSNIDIDLDASCNEVAAPGSGYHLLVVAFDSSGLCERIGGISGAFGAIVKRRPEGFLVNGAFEGTFQGPGFSLQAISQQDSYLLALDEQFNVRFAVRDDRNTRGETASDDHGNVYWEVQDETASRVTLRSFRPDGVERWTVEIEPAILSLEHGLSVNGDGEIAISVTADGDLHVGSTVIPGNGRRRLVLKLAGR